MLASHAGSDRAREIEDAIGGVLCRCTGYLKIVDAVAWLCAHGCQTHRRCHRAAAVGAAHRTRGRRREGHRAAIVRRRCRRPPTRSGCASIRSPHARATSRSAISTRSGANTGSPPSSPPAMCPARTLRHLPEHQGPAGASPRARALPRRGGARPVGSAQPRSSAIDDADVADHLDAAAAAHRHRRGARGPGARAIHAHASPTTC